jgi:hypothetical protein
MSELQSSKSPLHSRVGNGSALLPGVDGRSGWLRRVRDQLAAYVADLAGEKSLRADPTTSCQWKRTPRATANPTLVSGVSGGHEHREDYQLWNSSARGESGSWYLPTAEGVINRQHSRVRVGRASGIPHGPHGSRRIASRCASRSCSQNKIGGPARFRRTR